MGKETYLYAEEVVEKGADEVIVEVGRTVPNEKGEDGEAGGSKVAQHHDVGVGAEGFCWGKRVGGWAEEKEVV